MRAVLIRGVVVALFCALRGVWGVGVGVDMGKLHKGARMGEKLARGEAVRVAVDLGRVLVGFLWRVISARVRSLGAWLGLLVGGAPFVRLWAIFGGSAVGRWLALSRSVRLRSALDGIRHALTLSPSGCAPRLAYPPVLAKFGKNGLVTPPFRV